MNGQSPYLKAHRLGDVIAALQFLGQYENYKHSVATWDKRMAIPPQSVPSVEGQAGSWQTIFDEHPEFFRKNDEGRVSLVWRRAMAKTPDDQRPPLAPDTIARLIDTATRLHATAVEAVRADEDRKLQAERADEDRQLQKELGRRWKIQMRVSILTAFLAFVGVVLAAWLKLETPSGDPTESKPQRSIVAPASP